MFKYVATVEYRDWFEEEEVYLRDDKALEELRAEEQLGLVEIIEVEDF